MGKDNIFDDSPVKKTEEEPAISAAKNEAQKPSRSPSPSVSSDGVGSEDVKAEVVNDENEPAIPSLLDDDELEVVDNEDTKDEDKESAVDLTEKVILQISTGETLTVPKVVVESFGVVNDLLEFDLLSGDTPIPLPGCDSLEYLGKIVDFCVHQAKGTPDKRVPVLIKPRDKMDSKEKQERIDGIPAALLEDFPTSVARECMMLAFYLRIPAAEDALTLINARHLSLMSIKEMREYLGAEDDLGLEEKKALFKRHEWALSKEDKEFVLAEIAEAEEARAKLAVENADSEMHGTVEEEPNGVNGEGAAINLEDLVQSAA